MPYKSEKQRAWAHTPSGEKALGASGVKEWDQASKGLKLPKKVTEHDTHFIAHMADGGEVKIAKKGLGPKVLHRLTGMAMAAPQVQHMADGGDVVDMGDATEVPQAPRIDIPAHVLSQGEVDRALGTDTVPPDESGAGEPTLTGEAPAPAVGLPAPAAAPAVAPKVGGGGGADTAALDRAYKSQMEGAEAKARLEAAAGAAENKILQDQQDAQLAKQKIHDDEAQKVQSHITTLEDDINNSKIDPNHFFNSKSTGGKIGAILGLALGGLGGGMARGPNVALAMLNKQIDQDIDAQKENINKKNNLVGLYYKKLGNMDQALLSAKADIQAAAAVKMKQYGAMARGDVAQANLKELSAQWEIERAKTKSALTAQGAATRLTNIHAAIGEQQLAASGANTQQAEMVRQIKERLYAGKGTPQDEATLHYLGDKGVASVVQTAEGGRAYAHDDKTATAYRTATAEAIPAINNIKKVKGLLDKVGVGTIDQGTLGELNTRINSLAQTLPKAASGLTRVTQAEIEVALHTLGNPNSPLQTRKRSLAVLNAYQDELSDRVGTAADQYLIKPGADRSEVTQTRAR